MKTPDPKDVVGRMNQSLNQAIKTKELNEEASWNYQHGILLSYKDAESILPALNLLYAQKPHTIIP